MKVILSEKSRDTFIIEIIVNFLKLVIISMRNYTGARFADIVTK